MGLLNFLVGNAGDALSKPIDAVRKIVGQVYNGQDEKLTHDEVMARLQQNPQLWQAQTNQLDAQSGSNYRGGWRPLLGYISDLCVALYFIPMFIIGDIFWIDTCLKAHGVVPYPINADQVMNLVYILLGNGAMKTVEKVFSKN